MHTESFDERLRVVHDHLLGGAFDICVEASRSLRRDLEALPDAQRKESAERLGWAYFYELKGLYELRRHDDIAALAMSYQRDDAPMSYKNESWLFSAAAETARIKNQPEDIVIWGRKAAAIAAQAGDEERAFRAATAAAWLLKDMNREDLNEEFAFYLLEKGLKAADARALADGVTHLVHNFNKSHRGELARYMAAHAEVLQLAIQAGPSGFAAMIESWFLREDVLASLDVNQRRAIERPLSLIRAAQDGDIAKIGEAIKKGSRVNDIDIVAGRTALMAAILGGQMAAVELLLDAGADLNIRNPQGRTALVMAADYGMPAVVKVLLERKADPLLGDNRGVTALHAAAVGGFTDIVAMMLAAGLDADHSDEFGNTALIRAAAMGHIPTMELLLANKADLDARGSRKVTPLIAAAQECRLDAVKWLVAQGADIDLRDVNKMSALDWVEYIGERDETMRGAAEAVAKFLKEEYGPSI